MKNKLVLPEYIRKNLDKYKYVLIVCCAGLLLTMQPGKSAGQTPDEGQTDLNPPGTEDIQAAEERLAGLLGEIEGVGRVQVMLTDRKSVV